MGAAGGLEELWQLTWDQIPALTLFGCVALGRFPNISGLN